MKALVHVTVKPDVLDPQGRAIQRGCASLGYAGVRDVRQGKVFEIELDAPDRAAAERLLLELAEKGQTREDAYRLVQGHAMDTWEKGGHFKERMLADPEIARVLSKEEIEGAFDLDASLRNVDAIFARTLGEKA